MTAKDSGWSWVVLGGSCVNSFLAYGLVKSSGVVYSTSMVTFNASRAQAALLALLALGIACQLSPITGSLAARFSPRKVVFLGGLLCTSGLFLCYFARNINVMLIGYGIILGCGAGCVIVPNTIVLNEYFDKRRSVAIGLSMAGSCAGAVIFPPAMQALENRFGLQGTMLVLGGMLLHICPCSLLFRPIKKSLSKSTEEAQESDGVDNPNYIKDDAENGIQLTKVVNGHTKEVMKPSHQIYKRMDSGAFNLSQKQTSSKRSEEKKESRCFINLDFNLFRNFHFLLVVVSGFCLILCFPVFVTIIPDYAEKEIIEDISPSKAAFLVSVYALGDMFGRSAIGYVADKRVISLKLLLIVNLIGMASTLSIFPLLPNYIALVSCCIVFGMLCGGGILLPMLLLNDYLTPDKIPVAFGYYTMVGGFPAFCAPAIVALITDSTGSYKGCFVAVGLFSALGAILWLVESLVIRVCGWKSYHVQKAEDKGAVMSLEILQHVAF